MSDLLAMRSPMLWLCSVPLLQKTLHTWSSHREQHTVHVRNVLMVRVAQESSTHLSLLVKCMALWDECEWEMKLSVILYTLLKCTFFVMHIRQQGFVVSIHMHLLAQNAYTWVRIWLRSFCLLSLSSGVSLARLPRRIVFTIPEWRSQAVRELFPVQVQGMEWNSHRVCARKDSMAPYRNHGDPPAHVPVSVINGFGIGEL